MCLAQCRQSGMNGGPRTQCDARWKGQSHPKWILPTNSVSPDLVPFNLLSHGFLQLTLAPFNPPPCLTLSWFPFQPSSPLTETCPQSDSYHITPRRNSGIMVFREKVKRALHRSRSNSKPNCNSIGIKIEYYRRHEIPPSKFRGPFDPDHQKRLAAYNLQTAQEDRPRSPDLSLSPCATLPPDYVPQPLDATRPESNSPSDLFDSTYFLFALVVLPTSNLFQIPQQSIMTSMHTIDKAMNPNPPPRSIPIVSTAP